MLLRMKVWRRLSRCQLLLLALLVAAGLLYLLRWRHPHLVSLTLLLRNRYYNQLLRRAPPLPSDLGDEVRVLLYWTPFFQNTHFYAGFGSAPFAHCPVNACVATNDRQYTARASALLFHGADISGWDLPAARSPRQLYVFFSHEAPAQPEMPLGALNSAFNLTMSYRRDSDVVVPYATVVGRDREPQQSRWDDGVSDDDLAGRVASGQVPPPGQPSVAWVVSNCHTASLREQYVIELRRHVTVQQYGRCNGVPCGGRRPGDALSCYRRLARDHLFYLAFENHLCRDYITEKLFWALRAGLIPVVRGASVAEYGAVAPPHSFLHVDEFADAAQLAARLRQVASNGSLVRQLTAWRRRYTVDVETARWCELCARMHRPAAAEHSTVPDLRHWWYDDGWCHVPAPS